jgi:hypothetical protein
MKKKILWIIIFLIVYTIISEKFHLYTVKEDKDNKIQNYLKNEETLIHDRKKINISWEFKTKNVDIKNMGKVDLAEIYLLIEDESIDKILLGSFLGKPFEIIDANKYVLPKESILICEVCFDGNCDDFLVSEENNAIIIKHRRIGESIKKKKIDENRFYINKIIYYDKEIYVKRKR